MADLEIRQLQTAMKDQGIDYYLVPTSDFHNSEYVSDYFKKREFLSGFTGSNGSLLVDHNSAILWTDGRYFIQAERELQGTCIELFKMGEPGVPTMEEYLAHKMKAGETLGFDGRVVDTKTGETFEKIAAKCNGKLSFELDLAGAIWENIPSMPAEELFLMPEEYSGLPVQDKIELVRAELIKQEATALVISKLDDIMWLFNIRGLDVECNPVALSFGYITMEQSVFFVQKRALSEDLTSYFVKNKIQVEEYHNFYEYLKANQLEKTVLCDVRYTNFTTYQILKQKCTLIKKTNPTELLKAKKNSTELKWMREIYEKDSRAVTKFLYWLKTRIGQEEITEVTAADYLETLRKEIPEFIELSFPTISAYKENAAMMHYEANPNKPVYLKPEGMYLVDSGGQYYGGTTDVTRTIALGPVTDEMKKHFTLTAVGMLTLSAAVFLDGCTGRSLDILARRALWEEGIDYKCGTGHGVGYCLNVHEGPQGIRFKYPEGYQETALSEGMVVTNEPGVYIEDSHGIRIENVLVVKEKNKNSDGLFYCFETLTFVPIDLDLIDVTYMSKKEVTLLNAYHQKVYSVHEPYLNSDEKEWLKKATREISLS